MSGPANASAPSANGAANTTAEDDYSQDQVKVFSHEGDGENTEHLNSMDLHDIKTELERDAEKAETPKSVSESGASPAFSTEGSNSIATTSSGLAQAGIRPIIHPPTATAMVYANGSAVPFMIPPFAAAAGTSPLYPVMRPVKVESDWKATQAGGGQLSIPTYSYPAGFLPVDQNGLRPAYPFMAIPSQYVTAQMPYQAQFTTLGHSVAPNATVQPNSGGMIAPQVKEKKPHIKKPLNAFMLFMKQKRADVIKECTLKESAAINQILGKMWHALDRTEQAKYYEMAREERAKHMQMYPGWSARDNYAIHKKRRKRKVKQVESKEEGPVEEDRGKDVGESGSVGGNLVPSSLPPPVAASMPLSQGTTSPIKTTPPLNNHMEEDDVDLNNRKCRARFGLDQQHMWCGPCRRKKKCIRSFSTDEDEQMLSLKEGGCCEVEDEVLVTPGEASVMLSQATTTQQQEDNNQHAKELPHMLRPNVPVTLRTIPT